MYKCRVCDSPVEPDAKFCPNCGASIVREEPGYPMDAGGFSNVPYSQMNNYGTANHPPVGMPPQSPPTTPPVPPPYEYRQNNIPPYNNPYNPPFVPNIDTSGLLAWSILCTIFCLPLGLVALIMTLGINNVSSQEEAENKKRSVKIICTISTILTVALIVLGILLWVSIISDPYMYYGYY